MRNVLLTEQECEIIAQVLPLIKWDYNQLDVAISLKEKFPLPEINEAGKTEEKSVLP